MSHFLYQRGAGGSNNLRHRVPSIEVAWGTHRWAIRIFAFLAALAEASAFLACRCFAWGCSGGKQPAAKLEFRRKLAFSLINNRWRKEAATAATTRVSPRKRVALEHRLLACPQRCREWRASSSKRGCAAKAKLLQHVCSTAGCRQRIRTYCSCSKSAWMCSACHTIHCIAHAAEPAEPKRQRAGMQRFLCPCPGCSCGLHLSYYIRFHVLNSLYQLPALASAA